MKLGKPVRSSEAHATDTFTVGLADLVAEDGSPLPT